MRSSLLIQQNQDTGPHFRVATRCKQHKISRAYWDRGRVARGCQQIPWHTAEGHAVYFLYPLPGTGGDQFRSAQNDVGQRVVAVYPQERKRFVKLFLDGLINAPKELWHVVIDEAHLPRRRARARQRTPLLAFVTNRITQTDRDL